VGEVGESDDAFFKQMLRYGIQGYSLTALRQLRGVRATVAWGAEEAKAWPSVV
jgi:hypothetical protein